MLVLVVAAVGMSGYGFYRSSRPKIVERIIDKPVSVPCPESSKELEPEKPRTAPRPKLQTSQQQVGGKDNVQQAGAISQGPGSIAQVGSNNQASIVSGPPDRTLTASQEGAIAEVAKGIPAQIRIVVEHPTDYESSEYGKVIHDALAEFRSADLGTALSYGGQPPPVGLYVLAHTDDSNVMPYANQLYDAMKKVGIPCEAYQVDFVPAGTLRISVGVKPPLKP